MKRTNKSVYVYFNLHRKLWSVQSRKTQRVLYHTDVLLLYNCKFIVRQAGRKRVLKEKRKNVHAGVAGELDWANATRCSRRFRQASFRIPHGFEAPVPVTYNPYKYESFVRKDNLEPVTRANFCSMDVHNNDKVLAWNLESSRT